MAASTAEAKQAFVSAALQLETVVADTEDSVGEDLKAFWLIGLFDVRHSWLQLELTRDTATSYLGNVVSGMFVVRSRGSKKQEWAISIVQDGKVVHYRIRYELVTGEEDDDGHALPSGMSSTSSFKDFQVVNKDPDEFAPRKFATIEDFVAHYARYPIATGIAEGALLDVRSSTKPAGKITKRTKARSRLEALRDAEKQQQVRQTVCIVPEAAEQAPLHRLRNIAELAVQLMLADLELAFTVSIKPGWPAFVSAALELAPTAPAHQLAVRLAPLVVVQAVRPARFLRITAPTDTAVVGATPPTASERAAAAIALAPPGPPHDCPVFARRLVAALFPDNDAAPLLFDDAGTPLLGIFVGSAAPAPTRFPEPDPARVELAAAAVRCMLDARVHAELWAWEADPKHAGAFVTALVYTQCLDRHLQRYVDTPIGLLQTLAPGQLGTATIPGWYDAVLSQPAVEALGHQLERRRAAAKADAALIAKFQTAAAASLQDDQKLYGVAKKKAEDKNPVAVTDLTVDIAKAEIETRKQWAADPATGEPARPGQPGLLAATATIAQVKLQAVQQAAAFQAAVDGIGAGTGLEISMVRGSLDPATKLLTTYRGEMRDAPPGLLFLSKAAYRMAQKVWVRGNASTICDVNRALAKASDVDDMLAGARAVFASPDIEIVDIKDRVTTPTSGGWSDLVVLFRSVPRGRDGENQKNGKAGHVGELQLALSSMMVARKGMDAHEA